MRYSAAEKLEIIQLVELNLNISSKINSNARALDVTVRIGILGGSKDLAIKISQAIDIIGVPGERGRQTRNITH
jgi:hypothetical protein